VSTATAARRGQEVRLDPPATAMVWYGPDLPHQAVGVPAVDLDRGEVLVQVELATICGSDLHTVLGRRSEPVPLVLGHEYVGRIVAIGAGGARTLDESPLAVGDRVVWSIASSCGRCDRCRRDLENKCRDLVKYGHARFVPEWGLSGGFATHVQVRRGTPIVRVLEELDGRILAPLSCGTPTAWAAVDSADRIACIRRATVLITGVGLIGLTACAMATDRGAAVVVADPVPARRELALRFGAVAACDPSDDGALERAFGVAGGAPIAAIELSGAPSAVESAIAVVDIGGVVILAGSVYPTDPIAVAPEQIVRRLLTVRGNHNYPPRALLAASDYLHARGDAYPFAELVGEIHPLARLDDAIARADGGPVRVGVAPAGR
jgi:putative phosphonate catabolism associated alcohol dehydrogenase